MNIFDKTDFRPKQREIINACVAGRDVFACIQTGGGKSLTFQLNALTSPGLTLVFMPLVSLIQDQVMQLENMRQKILKYLHKNNLNTDQNVFLWCKNNTDTVIKGIRDNTLKILFITPEMLSYSVGVRDALSSTHLNRICIDECHVVSSWGHDFRPDYKNLSKLRNEYFPNTPILALTATAPYEVREDVIKILGLKNVAYFQNS